MGRAASRDIAWRLEALVYDLIEAVARVLPVDLVSDIGGWLAATIGPHTRLHGVAYTNLRIAFPGLPEAEILALQKAQWWEAGRWVAEFPIIDRIVADPSRVEIVGAERLAAVAACGKPAVFISAHFALFELVAWAIVQAGIPCQITYRAANNPYFDERMGRARFRYGVRLFAPKGLAGVREVMRAMARGESVALMNDQKFNGGVAAPLFGVMAHTAQGPSALALRFGAPLIPMTVQRLKKARFRVIVHDPIPIENTGDHDRDVENGVRKVNAFVEARVRERPSEWFWVHKRWPNEAYRRNPARTDG